VYPRDEDLVVLRLNVPVSVFECDPVGFKMLCVRNAVKKGR
jgi:hypothetical protein